MDQVPGAFVVDCAWPRSARAETGHCRDHAVHSFDGGTQTRRVADVTEHHLGRLSETASRTFEVPGKDTHFMSALKQEGHENRSEVAGASCHENPHRTTWPRRASSTVVELSSTGSR